MLHSNRIEKPEGMSLTWKPRLVKTPTPTLSATTIAVASTAKPEAPPPRSRPGHAALPASDAAMSVRTQGYRPAFIVQADDAEVKQSSRVLKSVGQLGILMTV